MRLASWARAGVVLAARVSRTGDLDAAELLRTIITRSSTLAAGEKLGLGDHRAAASGIPAVRRRASSPPGESSPSCAAARSSGPAPDAADAPAPSCWGRRRRRGALARTASAAGAGSEAVATLRGLSYLRAGRRRRSPASATAALEHRRDTLPPARVEPARPWRRVSGSDSSCDRRASSSRPRERHPPRCCAAFLRPRFGFW